VHAPCLSGRSGRAPDSGAKTGSVRGMARDGTSTVVQILHAKVRELQKTK
jgi:hypothetical protein